MCDECMEGSLFIYLFIIAAAVLGMKAGIYTTGRWGWANIFQEALLALKAGTIL